MCFPSDSVSDLAYPKFLILFVSVLMAAVNSTGDSTLGEAFSLICSITRAQDLTGDVTIQWIGPDGNPVTTREGVVVGTPGTSEGVTSLSLQFTTLLTSHGGEYTCMANLASQDTMYTISALQDVFVRGKNN